MAVDPSVGAPFRHQEKRVDPCSPVPVVKARWEMLPGARIRRAWIVCAISIRCVVASPGTTSVPRKRTMNALGHVHVAGDKPVANP